MAKKPKSQQCAAERSAMGLISQARNVNATKGLSLKGPKIVGPKKPAKAAAMGKPPKLDMGNLKKQDALLGKASKSGVKMSADEMKAVKQIRDARTFGGNRVGPKIVGPKKPAKGMK
jgi:hypothetical protein